MTQTKHRTLWSVFALVLVLAVVSTAAADTAFSFRGGITWNTTPEQMLAAEGVTSDGYTQQEENGHSFFYIKGKNAFYVYRDQQLLQAYTTQSADAYAGLLESRTAQLGAPVAFSADQISALINALNGAGTMIPQEITNLAAWYMPDGTLAALFMLGGKVCMTYFNEQAIAGGR